MKDNDLERFRKLNPLLVGKKASRPHNGDHRILRMLVLATAGFSGVEVNRTGRKTVEEALASTSPLAPGT